VVVGAVKAISSFITIHTVHGFSTFFAIDKRLVVDARLADGLLTKLWFLVVRTLLLLGVVTRVFGLEVCQIFLILAVLRGLFVFPEFEIIGILERLGFSFTRLFFVCLQLLPAFTYQFGNLGKREFLSLELIADFCMP